MFVKGFDSRSVREFCLRDIRNLKSEIYKHAFDSASGILIPEYERENDILLLGKKGDNTIQQIGLGENSLFLYSKFTGSYVYQMNQKKNLVHIIFHSQECNLKTFALRQLLQVDRMCCS